MIKVYLVAGALVACVLSFLGGRFTGPTKIVEKEKVVEKTVRDESAIAKAVADAKAQWSKEVQDHTVTRTIYKEGKIVEKVVFVDRNTKSESTTETHATEETKIVTHEEVAKTVEKEKIVENARPRLRLALSLPLRYPLDLKAIAPEFDVRLLGTVWLGARYVHTDKTPLRLSLGVEF